MPEFEGAVNIAKRTKTKWIELTPTFFDELRFKGIFESGDYFIYRDVFCCRHDDIKRIEEDMNQQAGHKHFGKTEGTVVGVTA